MPDDLTRLAVAVLNAKAERRQVAELRCCVSPDDETACLASDDACEAARAKLESALWAFFQRWVGLEVEAQIQKLAKDGASGATTE